MYVSTHIHVYVCKLRNWLMQLWRLRSPKSEENDSSELRQLRGLRSKTASSVSSSPSSRPKTAEDWSPHTETVRQTGFFLTQAFVYFFKLSFLNLVFFFHCPFVSLCSLLPSSHHAVAHVHEFRLLFYSGLQQMGWGPPALGWVMYSTQCTDLNVTLTQKHLQGHHRGKGWIVLLGSCVSWSRGSREGVYGLEMQLLSEQLPDRKGERRTPFFLFVTPSLASTSHWLSPTKHQWIIEHEWCSQSGRGQLLRPRARRQENSLGKG